MDGQYVHGYNFIVTGGVESFRAIIIGNVICDRERNGKDIVEESGI